MYQRDYHYRQRLRNQSQDFRRRHALGQLTVREDLYLTHGVEEGEFTTAGRIFHRVTIEESKRVASVELGNLILKDRRYLLAKYYHEKVSGGIFQAWFQTIEGKGVYQGNRRADALKEVDLLA